MTEIALELNGVSKKFKKGEKHNALRDFVPALSQAFLSRLSNGGLYKTEFWALRDVSFRVIKGQSFGIIGPNGAGKSTLLKLLTRIMTPTEGTISVQGRLSALIEVGAGFHEDLTGRENIYLNGTILGMTKHEIRQRFDQIVDFSGLRDFIDTPVKRYSSGMYARLGFSVAAHVNPEVLIVDEVLSVGDYLFQRACIEKMNAIMRNGTTVIFVSHDLRSVSRLCQKALFLEAGRPIMIGDTNDVIRSYLSRYVHNKQDESVRDVFISKVVIRGDEGEKLQFCSGEKAYIDVEMTARIECKALSVAIYLQESDCYEIFNTSSERLDNSTFSPAKGEKWQCSFELSLHLTSGTYNLGIVIYQYNVQRLYDEWFPAGTLFVSSDSDVRGGAQLYPKVLSLKPVAAMVSGRKH